MNPVEDPDHAHIDSGLAQAQVRPTHADMQAWPNVHIQCMQHSNCIPCMVHCPLARSMVLAQSRESSHGLRGLYHKLLDFITIYVHLLHNQMAQHIGRHYSMAIGDSHTDCESNTVGYWALVGDWIADDFQRVKHYFYQDSEAIFDMILTLLQPIFNRDQEQQQSQGVRDVFNGGEKDLQKPEGFQERFERLERFLNFLLSFLYRVRV